MRHIFCCSQSNTSLPKQSNIPVTVANCSILGRLAAGCKEQLVDVEKIYATDAAFAALKRDGSVVVWGHPEHGGDCQKVQDFPAKHFSQDMEAPGATH